MRGSSGSAISASAGVDLTNADVVGHTNVTLWSFSDVPSVHPVISLAIGNNFTQLFIVPTPAGIDPTTCTATFSLPSTPQMQGQTMHFQSFLLDLAAQNPLPAPTTNVESVTFQ